MDNQKYEAAVPIIRELLEFVNDGIKGYRTAAEETRDEYLKNLCLRNIDQRREFALALNAILVKCGVIPEESGTVKGALYRQWMDLKASLTDFDDEAIIASCLYGEEWTLKAYNDALDSGHLPLEFKSKIRSQGMRVQESYTELKELETLHHH